MNVILTLVTLFSLTLAATMTVVAWRLAREERRRSEARVAALAAEIHAGALDLQPRAFESGREVASAQALATPRFGWVPATALAAFVLGSAAALAVALSGAHTAARDISLSARGALSLELIELDQERQADRIVVRGVVRNPSPGVGIDRLTAVVLLFDNAGGFLGGGRAAIEASSLAPGAESAFVVTVPAVGDVGRYRVSFRTGDRVVPHVDRRRSPA